MILQHSIAIKPFLKRYMAFYCEVEPVFIINQKNRYSTYLLTCLRHKTSMENFEKKYTIADKTEDIIIRIPEVLLRNYGINISIKHQYWFNKFLQEEFLEKMMMFVSPHLTGKKGELKEQLLRFRSFYDISEDELPFRTLEKMWERNRLRIPLYRLN